MYRVCSGDSPIKEDHVAPCAWGWVCRLGLLALAGWPVLLALGLGLAGLGLNSGPLCGLAG